jgi:hypothetical protein
MARCGSCGQTLVAAATTRRSTGISMLVAVEIVIALVGLWFVVDSLYWTAYSTYYGAAEAGLDMATALAYLSTAVAGFVLARGLWTMKPWAWPMAGVLSIVLLGFDVLSVFIWGVTVLDLIGVAAHLSVLYYLNTNAVRSLFGRPPATFLQGAR